MAITAILGNVVRIGPASAPILVKDSSGALVDPATISVTVRCPDGTTTAPATPTRDSLGTFHLDYEPAVTPAMVGDHRYRIVATNPDAAYEGVIHFSVSPFL